MEKEKKKRNILFEAAKIIFIGALTLGLINLFESHAAALKKKGIIFSG